MRRHNVIGFICAIILAMAAPAFAAWPDRPITLIVPWGAGGAADQLSRALAPMLEKDLKVPVNVVLRPGGSGAVGHTAIAQAAPDGYTWGLATVEITMMHWQKLAPIQPKDFTVAAIINADAGGLIVRTESPYKTAKELIDDIKAKPASTFKASGTGQGGIWHLGLVGWLLAEKVDPKKVPWVPNQGAGPSMQDLVAGGVDFVTASLPEGRALIDAGKARALAQMDGKRLALYPNVPTLKEAAGSDWTILTWRGVLGPAGIPADIREKMVAALKKAHESAGIPGLHEKPRLRRRMDADRRRQSLHRQGQRGFRPHHEGSGPRQLTSMKFSDLLIGAVLILIGAGVLAYGLSLPPLAGQRYGAGLFPILLGCCFAGFGSRFAWVGLARAPCAAIAAGVARRLGARHAPRRQHAARARAHHRLRAAVAAHRLHPPLASRS